MKFIYFNLGYTCAFALDDWTTGHYWTGAFFTGVAALMIGILIGRSQDQTTNDQSQR